MISEYEQACAQDLRAGDVVLIFNLPWTLEMVPGAYWGNGQKEYPFVGQRYEPEGGSSYHARLILNLDDRAICERLRKPDQQYLVTTTRAEPKMGEPFVNALFDDHLRVEVAGADHDYRDDLHVITKIEKVKHD